MSQALKENRELLAGSESTIEISRDKGIIRVSVIGIIVNILLALFKVGVGIVSNSIAVILDAINNISDAASSIITIIGTKLAAKPADRKHPFGYGRIEYLSAMVISIIILYAGLTSLEESVKKIIHPDTPDYSFVSMLIIAVAVLVKIFLGRYVKAQGEKYNSDSLINSGQDATLDSIISASTLLAAVIYTFSGFAVEAYLGAVISIIIIKSGIEMLKETISKLLGEGYGFELAKSIKQTVVAFDGVRGAYDLVLNNYGPDTFNGSIHIEVPDTYTAEEIDRLVRNIQTKVYSEHKILLTAIGVYSYNTKNEKAMEMRQKIMDIVKETEYVIQMHGFYLDEENKNMRFDLVISFEAGDRKKVFNEIIDKIKKEYPGYTINGAIDIDYSELA